MNIIFIGGFFPKEYTNQIRIDSIGPIANANNTLQWAYINGLQFHLDLNNNLFQLISIPQIGAYPFRYKKPYFHVKSMEFGEKEGLQGVCLDFFNLKAFKHISHYFAIKKALVRLLSKPEWNKDVLLIVYDLQAPILKAIASVKRLYPNLRCCLIVPDLHGLTGGKQDMLHHMFEYIENREIMAGYNIVDSFVLISEHMKDQLPVNDKPWIVIEGIYNPNDFKSTNKKEVANLKKIFYSGALDERNGVKNLLQAFSLILDPSYRLILCGDGDLRILIEAMAKKDYRIEYKGQLPRSEVIKLQECATLLVNPRLPGSEFTKYSFPSKTMEYFGSGVPVLMYRLEGIPDEYYDFCYTPKNESVGLLKELIVEICSQSQQALQLIGEKAQEFVKTKKNSVTQASKLLEMITKSFKY